MIKPIRDVQELLARRPYVTRFYSTLSAADMTLDPVFTSNPDLEDVSNLHNAERIIECNSNIDLSEANWRIELPQGGVIRGRPEDVGTWPDAVNSQPPNLRVLQLSTSGAGAVLADNRAEIEAQLGQYNDSVTSGIPMVNPNTGEMPPSLGNDVVVVRDKGCSLGSAPFTRSRLAGWGSAALLLALAGLGMAQRASPTLLTRRWPLDPAQARQRGYPAALTRADRSREPAWTDSLRRDLPWCWAGASHPKFVPGFARGPSK